MSLIRSGLIVLALAFCASGGARAETTPAVQSTPSAPGDFSADRWGNITMTGEELAGVLGQSEGDRMLFACIESDRTTALSFHPADQSGLSEDHTAVLAFDDGKPLKAVLRSVKTPRNFVFILVGADPNFGSAIKAIKASNAVEVSIVHSGTVQSRHRFSLEGATDAIAPAQKLCGQ